LTSSFFTSVLARPSEGSLVHRNKRLAVTLHVLFYGDNAWIAAFREVKSGAEKYKEERTYQQVLFQLLFFLAKLSNKALMRYFEFMWGQAPNHSVQIY
jgi:hypothetical protein